jgi:putative sigma-54 modulation protein
MEVQITENGVILTNEQRHLTNQRVHFALGRFCSRVRSVAVLFTDQNGPKGGKDVLCKLRIRLNPGGQLLITDSDSSVEAAITNSADRAGRSVARLLDRQREHSGVSMSGE